MLVLWELLLQFLKDVILMTTMVDRTIGLQHPSILVSILAWYNEVHEICNNNDYVMLHLVVL